MSWFDGEGFAISLGLSAVTALASISAGRPWFVTAGAAVFWPMFSIVGQYLTRDL